jgi:DNA-binding XRE family transcriptional regulator
MERLAKEIRVSRQRISAIENGDGASQMMATKICDHFRLGSQRRGAILAVATNSRVKGWWTRHEVEMGPRQALAANLETGAARICEFQLSLIPGLLQTAEYSEARVQADPSAATDGFDPSEGLRARSERQRRLAADSLTLYDVVIDELAIRRRAAPPDIMRQQMKHLFEVAAGGGRTTIRVLPIDANIVGQAVPRSAFSIYHYRDPEDPVVVTVDTMTEDQIHLRAPAVTQYRSSYDRLRAAALTPQRTKDLLASLAGDLQEIGIP